MSKPPERPRRNLSALEQAEAVFKTPTPKADFAPSRTATPPAGRELVSLRLDRDVLAHFQDEGPGWQERINEALRKAAGLRD